MVVRDSSINRERVVPGPRIVFAGRPHEQRKPPAPGEGELTLRAGIIGCGRIGSEFDDDPRRKEIATHAGAYRAVSGVELVAACDLDAQKLARCGTRWQIPSLYQDSAEMLRNESLDILSICTWPSSRLAIVEQAANSGVKAVFCEKPIADSLRNATAMVQLCDSRGVILQIDHQRRFDRFHQEVRAFLQAGKLGRVQQVNFRYTAGIANTGSHMFDLLRFLFGDVQWVQAVYSENHSHNANDPNLDGMLRFRGGPLCMVQACDARSYLVFELDSLGTQGRLRVTHSGLDVDFYEVKESALFSGYKEIYPAASPVDSQVQRDCMVQGVAHLIECLRQGKRSISSGEDGRAALELICAFHESARADGKRIPIPLVDS